MSYITKYNPYNRVKTWPSLLDEPFFGDSLFKDLLYGTRTTSITEGTGDTVRFNEDDTGLHVEVDLPGVPKNDIKVNSEARVVYIEAGRKVIHRGGTSEEKLTRSFSVGKQYDVDSAKVTYVDGVLKLSFAKDKALLKEARKEIKVS